MASFLNAVSGCDGFICCIGCLSLVPGLVRRVVNQVAFFPPRPPGYHVTEEKQVFLVEADYGLTPLPDLTAEGIAVDTVRMWTRRGNVILGFHFRRADSRRTLLFSHGNSTDIGIMFHHLRDLCTKLQVDVFAYEYSGYGESTGMPSEADLYSDVEAAYHYLTHDCSVPDDQIICYGQSIGSVPSIDLASRASVGGVVLHSAMKSGLGVIHDVKTTYWFDVFQNAARIQRVHAPVFIIHGTHDTEIPFEHGQTLYEACPEEMAYDPWWVKEAGHNDIEINHRASYFEQLLKFFRALDSHERNWRKNTDHEIEGEIEQASLHSSAFTPGLPSEASENGWQPLLGGAYNSPACGRAPTYNYEPMSHY